MFDPHIHVECLRWEDLKEMKMCGIDTVVSYTYYPQLAKNLRADAFFDFFDRLLTQEKARTEYFMMNEYIAVGVLPICAPFDFDVVLKRLPEYLKLIDCVAIGEVGIDPRSKLMPDIKDQENLLRKQLEIAGHANKPVSIHTPPTLNMVREIPTKTYPYEKADIIKRDIQIVREVGLDSSLVVIDHLEDKQQAQMVLDAGLYAGLTPQPWRSVDPIAVASVIKELGADRILVSSDSSYTPSDHLGVPKTAFELRKLGASEDIMDQVFRKNPAAFYMLTS